jgi:hypothetical protein
VSDAPGLVQGSGSQFKGSTFKVRRSAGWKIAILLTGERRTLNCEPLEL